MRTKHKLQVWDIPAWRVISPSGLREMRVIRIGARRTSLRLETEMWVALEEIAEREKINIPDLCGHVDNTRLPGGTYTAALRAFLIGYYRAQLKGADWKLKSSMAI